MTRKEKSNGHRAGDGHRTETPDVSHIRNVEVTHETSDVSVRGVLTFGAALAIATIVISIGLVFLFNYFDAQEAKEPGRGPMAVTEKEERLPPEPRLQAAPGFRVTLQNGQKEGLELQGPQSEYRVLREQWENALNSGMKDQSGNTVGMPITQAIDQVVSGEGLPTRAKGAPSKLEDYAMPLPTAYSSGRETEKRLQ